MDASSTMTAQKSTKGKRTTDKSSQISTSSVIVSTTQKEATGTSITFTTLKNCQLSSLCKNIQ